MLNQLTHAKEVVQGTVNRKMHQVQATFRMKLD